VTRSRRDALKVYSDSLNLSLQMDSTLTEVGLKKLTIPQLKALCKERKRIVGYSKLNKDGIVKKLLDWQKSSQAVASTVANPAGDRPSPGPVQSDNLIAQDVSGGITNSSHRTVVVLPQNLNSIVDAFPLKPTKNPYSELNLVSSSARKHKKCRIQQRTTLVQTAALSNRLFQ